MSGSRATARHQQRVEELCAAAVRALSGEPNLHFRGRRLHRGHRRLPLHAPHLQPSLDDDFGSFRGAADGMALRLTHSDAELHRSLHPADPVQRLIFEMLEQFRVEALAGLPGVIANLRHRHVQWSLDVHHSGMTETSRGILLYTVAQVCRSRVTGQPVVAETEDLLEATRFDIVPALGKDLTGLRRRRHDQNAYAEHALAIARIVGNMLAAADENDEHDGEDIDDHARFPLFLDSDDDFDDTIPQVSTGHSRVLGESEAGYRAFTTAYDRQHAVPALVRAELLRDYRQRLDRCITGQGVNIPRLTRQLKMLLADPARNGWDGGQEEGHVDGRRLAQLIASPTERRLFRTERIEPAANCLVTFLIDCSGSMKEHIESIAVIVDVFARALELAGASSEILGFTTGAWNGGRAMREWHRSGRPAHPGRLNELCHLVFKDADTSWRRARPGIAGLLKADLFREGVDGEAVTWACRRMAGRSEQRRLLIVLSDGSPMDSATNLTNDRHYLDNHLKDVVRREELAGSARICGLGVGLDLSPFYRRSHALDLSRGPGNDVFREILEMIAGDRRS
ncbi:cobalt chelatase [Saccharopolyspora sp. WRP15-2]|uniref:Cobalt chelatase n=1 Tax=Saccharopolyspora oryzae TaxID=2997343 RepID=A0ABT4UVD9_9PSEU|nr:cobalt chelatase [Saccharopolyspora oryzae]MDA3625687.1 cobalt chelatase [Saccharopolyspora oryzae]